MKTFLNSNIIPLKMNMNMKKILSWGMMLAAAFTLTNCAKEIDPPVQEPESVGYPFEIVASTVDTKTVNDGMSTKWAAGDKLNVFHVLSDETNYVNDNDFTVSDIEAGVFTGTIAEQLDVEEEYDWYVMYPYNEKVITPGEKTAGFTYIGYSTGLNQTGYNSMASLKGSVCPLYGIAKYAGVRPEITMNHLSSIVAINVTNKNEDPLTISSASFTAPEDIVGSYFIDITGESVVYTPSDANYVKNTAIVNVTSGATALAKGESAILYAAIKPFTAAAGQKLTLSVNGYSKEIELSNPVTFAAGKIKTLNFGYDKVETVVPEPDGADKIVIDFSAQGYVNGVSVSDVRQMPVIVSFDKGSNSSNAPKYYTTGTAVRTYGGNTITVSSTLGKVVGVEFIFSTSETSDNSNGITADAGTLALPSWTGSEESVTFTISGTTGHRRIQKLEVYVDTEGEEWEPVQLETPDVECSAQTENTLTFQWNAITNALGYEVTFDGETVNVTETTYIAMELEPETEYEIAVKALGDGTYYLDSEVATITGETTEEVQSSGVPTDATLSFESTANRVTQTTSQQVWSQNGITLTNDKSSSTSNVGNYSNPARFYASSKITVTAAGNITKIVFDCNSASYATALKNSIGTVSGATVTISSDKVTVTFTTEVESFVIAKLSAQVRMDSITVTYLQ